MEEKEFRNNVCGSIRTQVRPTNQTHVLYPEGLYNIFFQIANATVDRNIELKT